jgi:peptidyl-dipeptidase A
VRAVTFAAAAAGAVLLLLAGCTGGSGPPAVPAARPVEASESADEFVARVNRDLGALAQEAQAAGFTQDTFITADTQLLGVHAVRRARQ